MVTRSASGLPSAYQVSFRGYTVAIAVTADVPSATSNRTTRFLGVQVGNTPRVHPPACAGARGRQRRDHRRTCVASKTLLIVGADGDRTNRPRPWLVLVVADVAGAQGHSLDVDTDLAGKGVAGLTHRWPRAEKVSALRRGRGPAAMMRRGSGRGTGRIRPRGVALKAAPMPRCGPELTEATRSWSV